MTCLSKPVVLEWQRRLERLPWMHRVADRAVLLGLVGNVEHFPGTTAQIKDQPNATAHALKPEMWSKDPERNALPITGDAERTLSDARGTIARRSEGQ